MPWMRSGILQQPCCSGCKFCFLVRAHVPAWVGRNGGSGDATSWTPFLSRQKWGKERPKGPCPLVNPSTFVTPYADLRPNGTAPTAYFPPESSCTCIVLPRVFPAGGAQRRGGTAFACSFHWQFRYVRKGLHNFCKNDKTWTLRRRRGGTDSLSVRPWDWALCTIAFWRKADRGGTSGGRSSA